MKKSRIQICPQCRSPDVAVDFSNAGAVATGFLSVYKCNNCGHEGTFFPTTHISKVKKPLAKKQAKNVKRIDTTFAEGYTKTYLSFISATLGLFGIILAIYPKTRPASAVPLLLAAILFVIVLLLKKN